MKLRIFVVFHKALDERLTLSEFSRAEIDELFVAYGVNESHRDKMITQLDGRAFPVDRGPANLLLEYRLPKHQPELQARGFLETSCYVHLVENDLLGELDYVGVTQYDMRWTGEAAALVRRLAGEPSGGNTVYGLSCGAMMNARGEWHPFAFPERCDWDFLLESYNRFFGRSWDRRIFVDKPFALWQTHLMPREEFLDLGAWLGILCGEVYPWANQPPYPTHWGNLAGCMERAEALFVAARLAEGRISFEPIPLEHDQGVVEVLGIRKEHYGGALPAGAAPSRN